MFDAVAAHVESTVAVMRADWNVAVAAYALIIGERVVSDWPSIDAITTDS